MFYKKKICYVLILACSIFLLTSCKSGEKDSDNSSVVVFTINDSNVYLDEVLYRVWESEDENSYYSGNFSDQYGESYWDSDIIEGTTVSESLKEELYDAFIAKAKAAFAEKYGHEPIEIPVVISDGARKLN